MKTFKNLSQQENDALLKYPVYISELAANGDGIFDEAEKKSAVSLAIIKAYSSEPLLACFHKEIEKVLEHNMELLDKELPKEKMSREVILRMKILQLEKIVLKLGKRRASAIHRSMNTFKEHVSKAHHNVLVDFIIPISIPGLTESK